MISTYSLTCSIINEEERSYEPSSVYNAYCNKYSSIITVLFACFRMFAIAQLGRDGALLGPSLEGGLEVFTVLVETVLQLSDTVQQLMYQPVGLVESQRRDHWCRLFFGHTTEHAL